MKSNSWFLACIIPFFLLNACTSSGNSTDVNPAYKECADYLEKRQLDKAENAVQKLLTERPNEGDAHYYAGLLLLKKQDYPAAVAELNRSLELSPKNAKAYSDRSFALLQTGKYQSALDDINDAIRMNPKRALNYHRRALIEHQLKEYAEAEKDFNESEKIDPKDFPYYVHYGRAETYVRMKEYTKALADYEAAVAIMPPGDNRASIGRAMCRLKMGDLAGAKTDCAKLMSVAPHDPTALALAGTVALLNGDKAAARRQYLEAAKNTDLNLSQMVDFKSANAVPAAELASTYIDLKKPKLAVALMSTIEIDRPLEAPEEMQLGRAYLALNQDERGLKLLNSCISTDPDDISPRLVMIEFYKRRGLLQKAEEVQGEGLSMAKTPQDKALLSAALR
jgi:tetratricopeptide (TPR) repeat protein